MQEHKPTQNDRIIRHMKDFGSITSMEAINEYGITRLAARISDLRDQGYMILRKPETALNRYGEKTHYIRYILAEGA